ncbi:MAG: DUF5312 family protein [Brevinematia bacterium]
MNRSERLREEIEKMPDYERENLRKKMEESIKDLNLSDKTKVNRNVQQEYSIVSLTLWDRFLIFVFSILGLMSLEMYINRKRLKIIKTRVASISPPLMNVKKKYLYPQFGKYLYEFYVVISSVSELLEMTVFNPNIWDNIDDYNFKTCSEYLFEFLTNTRSLFSITDLKSVISENKSLKKIFDKIEVEVNNNISDLDVSVINKANKIYTRLFIFRELDKNVDFKKLLRYFSDEKGRISNNAIPDFWFTQEIEKLCNIVSEIDITPMIIDVIMALKKYISEIIDKQSYDYKKFSKISQILSPENLNKVYEITEKIDLIDIVCILKDDPDFLPIFVVPEQSLVNVYRDVIISKSKNHATEIVNNIIKEKVDTFFYLLGKTDLEVRNALDNIIYIESFNDRLTSYKLDYFVYPVAFRVVYSIFNYFWKPYFRDALNDIVVNGIFKERYLKNSISSIIQSFDESEKAIQDFVKKVGMGGEYYNVINRFIEEPDILRSETSKKSIQQKIVLVNNLAGVIVVKYYDLLLQLNKYLKLVLDDYYSISPEYILNIKTIKGVYNKALIDTLKKGQDIVSVSVEILSYYTS